jgi:hypothetical protein
LEKELEADGVDVKSLINKIKVMLDKKREELTLKKSVEGGK